MKISKGLMALVLLAGLSMTASADVLILKGGQAITGKFQGGDPGGVSFLVNGQLQRYLLTDVHSITFLPEPLSSSSQAAPSTPAYATGRGRDTGSSGGWASRPSSAPAQATRAPSTPVSGISIPAGTVITVRMIDPVDSSVNQMGETFRASLDEPIVVNGTTVATRDADVTTKLVSVEEAGRMTGRSELALVLLDITINGRRYEVSSEEVLQAGSSRGAQTAKRVGGLAAVGAVIGAIAGGGKGAAQGAAAGAGAGAAIQIMTKGAKVQVPAESRLEFTLANSLTL
jgi:hypothetical protein